MIHPPQFALKEYPVSGVSAGLRMLLRGVLYPLHAVYIALQQNIGRIAEIDELASRTLDIMPGFGR